jgi:hypothetical protein
VLRETAEYPNSFVPLGPGDERLGTPRYTLCMSEGKGHNTVQRQRFAPHELDAVLAEVRDVLTQRGRDRTQWEIGSRARPDDLVAMLLERGLVPDEPDDSAVALVLRREPPPAPAGFNVRRVATLEEALAAAEVQFEAFGSPEDHRAEKRAALERSWERPHVITQAVWLDGEIVCAGTCATTSEGLALFGGATLPSFRGRGAYHALIAARWREANELGTPALLTQAGAMSRPILERLGFEAVGHLRILMDEFGES